MSVYSQALTYLLVMNAKELQTEEDELLAAVRTGSSAALSELLTVHRHLIKRVVAWPKWRFDEDIRKDVEQEIHHSLVKSLSNASSGRSVRAFIKRVCINRCIDEVRRQVRRRGIFSSMPTYRSEIDSELDIPLSDLTAQDPIDLITREEQLTELRGKLQELNGTCRNAIRQFYLDGMSYKEMAEELGITVNTVGSRLSKCLSQLRNSVFSELLQ